MIPAAESLAAVHLEGVAKIICAVVNEVIKLPRALGLDLLIFVAKGKWVWQVGHLES